MPIIKYKNVTLHFAHIPKCAGSSIEQYVRSIKGAELAFVDSNYVANPAKEPWNCSSPQHIDGVSFSRLFPKTYFDAFFAVIREPFSRLESAYKFQLMQEKTINESVSLDQFVKEKLRHNCQKAGWMDNHFLPQVDFLYPKTAYQIFRLEGNGMNLAKKFIDNTLFGNPISLPMRHTNAAKKNTEFDPNQLVLSEDGIQIVNEVYKADFERFKYPYS